MKKFLLLLFYIPLLSIAQVDTLKIKSFGIDVAKNIPFLLMTQNGYMKPRMVEGFVLTKARQPLRYYYWGVGYAHLERYVENRLLQTVSGVYVRFRKEFHGSSDKQFRFIRGYGFSLSVNKVAADILIKGNYFEDYRSSIPSAMGIGVGADVFVGYAYRLSKKLEARFLLSPSLAYMEVKNYNSSFYIPGVGIHPWKTPLIFTAGGSLQLYYRLTM